MASDATLPVSVIIITWNRRDELLVTLRAMERQTVPHELIVVDNGSTDGTGEAVLAAHPGARVVTLPHNTGVSIGRNRGIEAATHELLVFLDDDATFADATALQRVIDRFAETPGLGILATNICQAATGEPESAAIPRRDKRTMDTDYEAAYFAGGGFALRRELFERIGMFPEDILYGGEEMDLSWRALDAGFVITWAHDLVVLHRLSPLARPGGRWIRANMCNRLRLPIKFLPWHCVATYAAVWWPMLVMRTIQTRQYGAFARGLGDFCTRVPDMIRSRRVLPAPVRRRIRDLNGRYYH